MMDFDAFISAYYSEANEAKQKDVLRFLTNFEEALGDREPTAMLNDKPFLCNLFYIRKGINNISRAHYQKIKDYLLNLLAFFGITAQLPSMEEVIECHDTTLLFKDLDSLLDFIDSVGYARLLDYDQNADLVFVKGIVILGWYGFSREEIITMPKGNLMSISDGTRRVFFPNSPKRRYVDVSERAFNTLICLQDLERYRGLPSGKPQVFKGNERLLFRPTVSSLESLKDENIRNTLHRFNECIPPTKQAMISYGLLHKNALFVDIFNDKTEMRLPMKIMKHMSCSQPLAFGYQKQYLRWVEMYHNNEI